MPAPCEEEEAVVGRHTRWRHAAVVAAGLWASAAGAGEAYRASDELIDKLANGGVGKVSVCFVCRMPYRFNIDLLGSKGSARNNQIISDKYPGQTDFVNIPTVLPDSGDVTHHEFQEEIDHFVDCILKNKESHVNLADAVKTHEVALAIDQSAAKNRPVKLPLK